MLFNKPDHPAPQDSVTTSAYNLHVTRVPASRNARLSGLRLSHWGALSPPFDPCIFTYTATVPFDILHVTGALFLGPRAPVIYPR